MAPGLEEWYSDFQDLSTDRQSSMGIGPIPHSSIVHHTLGWEPDEIDAFKECMRAMDAVYLSHDPKKVVVKDDPLAAFNRMFGE